jgi:hypothetical protein
MKNKPDLALLGTSYLSYEIKKDTKISWDYPFKHKNFFEKVQNYFNTFTHQVSSNICLQT